MQGHSIGINTFVGSHHENKFLLFYRAYCPRPVCRSDFVTVELGGAFAALTAAAGWLAPAAICSLSLGTTRLGPREASILRARRGLLRYAAVAVSAQYHSRIAGLGSLHRVGSCRNRIPYS